MAEWTGLEPATPGVTGRYSNQLNYHSACWWVLRGSNPRPSPCKGDALPAELSTPWKRRGSLREALRVGNRGRFRALKPPADEQDAGLDLVETFSSDTNGVGRQYVIARDVLCIAIFKR